MTTPAFTPYCIQRLRAPTAYPADSVVPLDTYYRRRQQDASKVAGLRIEYADSIKALNDLFRLDYMGSAEFEFGAFGKALGAVVCSGRVVPVAFEVNGPTASVNLYGWAYPEHVEPLKQFVHAELASEFYHHCRLLEPTYMRHSCFGDVKGCGSDTVGWLDIDLGWFLTKDKALAEAAKKLLQVALT